MNADTQHGMRLELGDASDLRWAQAMVEQYHYLHQPVDPRARPMVYILRNDKDNMQRGLGLVMLGIPHATRCNGWWGYPGLPTQWQVVDLCRIWLDPDVQAGGQFCDPFTVPGFYDRHGKWRACRRIVCGCGHRSTRIGRITSNWQSATMIRATTAAPSTGTAGRRQCTPIAPAPP